MIPREANEIIYQSSQTKTGLFSLNSKWIHFPIWRRPVSLNQTLVCFMKRVKRLITANPRLTVISSQTQTLVNLRNIHPRAFNTPSTPLSQRQCLICDLQLSAIPYRSFPTNRALKLSSFSLLQHLKEMLAIDLPLGRLFCNFSCLVKKEAVVNNAAFQDILNGSNHGHLSNTEGRRREEIWGVAVTGLDNTFHPRGITAKLFPDPLDWKL